MYEAGNYQVRKNILRDPIKEVAQTVRFTRRFGVLAALVGIALGAMAPMAGAAVSFYYEVPGYGQPACSSLTETATNLAPDIGVELTQESPSGQTTANFTAGSKNCGTLGQPTEVTLNSGYQYIDANTVVGQSVKLYTSTGTFQGPITVWGYWKQ